VKFSEITPGSEVADGDVQARSEEIFWIIYSSCLSKKKTERSS
jgi:hypothetical protein